jgi:phosphatidylserine decarboxylase
MGDNKTQTQQVEPVDEQAMLEEHVHRLSVQGGKVAKQFEQINEYQLHVLKEIENSAVSRWNPEVVALGNTIHNDPFIRMYVNKMLLEVPVNRQHFKTVDMMLKALNYVVHTAPLFKNVESISWQFPLSSLMNFWMMTPSGKAVLRLPAMNDHLNRLMKSWCTFLNSEKSRYVLNESETGWLCDAAYKYNALNEYKIPDKSAPYWGFSCYNEFFHRDIVNQDARPVDAPGDQSIVNSPNDGVAWALQYDVKARDEFWLKGQYYSLDDMMNNNPLAESFIGGIVYQTYVNGGADWHRFTAPIDGKVVAAEVVTGYAWTESDAAPPDPMSGPYSQGWAAGVATRALIYIDSGCKKLGTVCVVPIGLTEVSSVELFVKEGDSVKKGDQLGWFSFGGSSFAIVFQPGAIKEILVKPPENRNDQPIDTMRANKRCAIANID